MPLTETAAPVADRKYALRFYSLITNEGGAICRHVLKYQCNNELADALTANKSYIEDYYNGTNNKPTLLKKEQFDQLFPGGRAASSPEKFDITLLMFLLRTFIFCTEEEKKMWKRDLDDIYSWSKTEVADLTRIKCYRNKIHDIYDTKTSLSEEDFWIYCEDLTAIFLRLGEAYRIPGVLKRIFKELHDPLDGERENELERQIQEVLKDLKVSKDTNKKNSDLLQAVDLGQTEISVQLKVIDRKLSFTVSKEDTEVVLPDEYFVKTEQYAEVRQALRDQKIIVLNGAPGEGKTTMAEKLVNEVSNGNFIKVTSYKGWETFDKTGKDAVLIDDMFGAGIFDKEGCRKWQKRLPYIDRWVNDCHNNTRYVVITSRTYILQEARKKMFLDNLFSEKNIHPLLTSKLLASEKLSILQNHSKLSMKNVPEILQAESNRKKRKKALKKSNKHVNLLQEISEMKIDESGPAFTIGFPECARLFASNEHLYNEGVRFFKEPMTHIMKCVSEICRNEDVFIAFFVLWAQESRAIRARDLEYSVQETSPAITNPIFKLQYGPRDHLRKMREELYNHAHDAGFIILDPEEQFRFSHNVIRDAVGIISFERNPTATYSFSDKEFITTYIHIPSKSPESHLTTQAEKLPKVEVLLRNSRFDQASARIANLAMASESSDYLGKSKESNFLRHHSLFKCELFQNEEFCTAFIETNRTAGNLETLLKTPLRRIDSELLQYKFIDLKKVNTEVRIPSFVLWHNETITFLAKQCFSEMKRYTPELLDQELFIALLIASSIGSYEMTEYLVSIGGQINSQMILMAYDNLGKERLVVGINSTSKQKSSQELFIDYLQSKAKLPDSEGFYPIHLAALEGNLDLVRAILQKDRSQAETRFNSLERSELSELSGLTEASLYHIAAYKQNKDLVQLLSSEKVTASALDSKGRTPLLYAIYYGKSRIAPTLLEVAKKNGNEMCPDLTGNTPLHRAIEKSVTQKQDTSKIVFKDISLSLIKNSEENKHSKNLDGQSPLYIACKFQAAEIVHEFFKRKQDFCRKEQTLLHKFVREDNIPAIELLLSYQFDHNLTDEENRTPLQLAEELEQIGIANLLPKRNTDLDACATQDSSEQNIEHSKVDEKEKRIDML